MAPGCRPIRASAALILGVLCAAALASPSTGWADTSFQAAAGDLAAHDGTLVWSTGPLAPPGPLTVGLGPASTTLPVSSARLGGMDLGTDARGRKVLVYSASRDLYLYSFESRRSRRLSSLSQPDCAEGSPEISRGAIVFARSRCGRPGLYLKRPGKRVRRLTELPPPTVEVLQHRGIVSLDLAGHTLAFVVRRVSDELPVGSTWRVVTEIRTLRLGQRHGRLLARVRKLESPTSTGTSVGQVQLDGGFAYWTRAVFNSCDPDLPGRQDIQRRPIDGSAPATVLDRPDRLYAQPECDTLGTYAVASGQLHYTFNDTELWPPNAIARVDGPLVFR